MNKDERESLVRKILYDLMAMKDLNLQPGDMFRFVRTYHNIPIDDFADLLCIPTKKLQDIEASLVPFPSFMLMNIFIHGIPTWYAATEDISE